MWAGVVTLLVALAASPAASQAGGPGLVPSAAALRSSFPGGRPGGGVPAGGAAGLSMHDRCEPITIPMCQNIAYNDTIFPNLMGNVNQEQAGQDMSNYVPLINIKCSPDIHLFLCAMYAPVCTILDYAIPPCRALCLSAKAGCDNLLVQFDFEWPKEFNCSKFPIGGKPDELCMGDGNHTRFSDTDLEHFKTSTPRPAGRPRNFENMMNFKCPVQLQMPPELDYKLRIGRDQVVEDCGVPCVQNVTFFDSEDVSFSHGWVAAWAVLCLASTAFTVATFLADVGRFPYPERPIVYLALCYGAVAAVLLVGYSAGEDIVCNPEVENRTMNFLSERTIRQGALGQDVRCTMTAMVFYFFLMAGSLWWVMLTVSWFLSAFLKWGQEAIDAKAQWLHFAAWTVPSFQTLFVIVMKKVEGDVLSGVCFVGLWDAASLGYFVALPLGVYLALGLVFLVLGFSSLFRIKTIMKRDGAKTEKLERLIWRIGLFSVLYVLPSAGLVACYLYEYTHLPEWLQLWQEDVCRDPELLSRWQTPCRYPDDRRPDVAPPELWVFLAKYLCLTMVGVNSGFWVCCGKTVSVWRGFFARICGGRQRSQAYV